MKTLSYIIAALLVSVSPLSAGGGHVYTLLIHDSDQAFNVTIQRNEYMKVLNFTQSGGTTPVFDPSTGGFVVTYGAIVLYQGANGLPGATILNAVALSTSTQVPHEDTYIAGPAVVYIAPVSGAVLALSYFRGSN
jgi:hypothetical protein